MSTGVIVLPPRVTRAEACRRTGFTLDTINRLIVQGELKCVERVGGINAVILESSLNELINRMLGNDQQRAG